MLVCQPSVATTMLVRIYNCQGMGTKVYRAVHGDGKDLRRCDIFEGLVQQRERLQSAANRMLKERKYQSLSFDIKGAELWEENDGWIWPEVSQGSGNRESEANRARRYEDDEVGTASEGVFATSCVTRHDLALGRSECRR